MIYHLNLHGPYLNRNGKRFFEDMDKLIKYLYPIFIESQEKTKKEYGVTAARKDIYNYISVTKIDTVKFPDYERFYKTKSITRKTIKAPNV
jgi:hypothetical protein